MPANINYTDLDPKELNKLLEKHQNLVKRAAYHLIARLPANIQVDDLIQAGMIGLIDAYSKFDLNKKVKFETYASIRIKGSMLDEIRKEDWLPRSVHQNSKKISEAIKYIETATGGEASDLAVSQYLNISLAKYHKLLRETNSAKIFSLDEFGISLDQLSPCVKSFTSEPEINLEKSRFKENLSKQIIKLPERERLVVYLYYREELNLREIGNILKVTESRVCQLLNQAMLRLRARMQDWALNN